MSEADLLEQYIDALLRDPHAPPPPTLDPTLVTLAHDLVGEYAQLDAAPQSAHRVWQQTLAHTQHSPNGKYIPQEQPVRRTRAPIWLAAALLLSVIVGIGIIGLRRPTNNTTSQPILTEELVTMHATAVNTPSPSSESYIPIAINDTITGMLTDATDVIYGLRVPDGSSFTLNLDASAAIIYSEQIVGTSGGGGGGGPISTQVNREFNLTQSADIRLSFRAANPDDLPIEYTLSLNENNLVNLAYGESIEGSLSDDRYMQSFTFEGQRGELVNLFVTDNFTADLQLILYDPEGFPIAQDDDSGQGFLPELTQIQLPINGTYRAEISFYTISGIQETPYILSVSLDQQLIQMDRPVSIILNEKRPTAVLIADVIAGETYSVTVSSSRTDLTSRGVTVLQAGEELALIGLRDEPTSATFTAQLDTEILISVNGNGGYQEISLILSQE